jgi:hypothetical protein
MPTIRKLQDLPRTEAGIHCQLQGKGGSEFMFYHPDGMYSYCETMDGDACHFKIWTEVIVHDPAYQEPLKRDSQPTIIMDSLDQLLSQS